MNTTPRYWKFSPRGFANEITYFAAETASDVAEIEAEFDDYTDLNPGATSQWTSDTRASRLAIRWADRDWPREPQY